MRRRSRSSFPGQYLARTSVMHRLPVAGKMILAGSVAVAALLAPTPRVTMGLVLLCAGIYAAARLGWRALRQDGMVVLLQAPLVLAIFFGATASPVFRRLEWSLRVSPWSHCPVSGCNAPPVSPTSAKLSAGPCRSAWPLSWP